MNIVFTPDRQTYRFYLFYRTTYIHPHVKLESYWGKKIVDVKLIFFPLFIINQNTHTNVHKHSNIRELFRTEAMQCKSMLI